MKLRLFITLFIILIALLNCSGDGLKKSDSNFISKSQFSTLNDNISYYVVIQADSDGSNEVILAIHNKKTNSINLSDNHKFYCVADKKVLINKNSSIKQELLISKAFSEYYLTPLKLKNIQPFEIKYFVFKYKNGKEVKITKSKIGKTREIMAQ